MDGVDEDNGEAPNRRLTHGRKRQAPTPFFCALGGWRKSEPSPESQQAQPTTFLSLKED